VCTCANTWILTQSFSTNTNTKDKSIGGLMLYCPNCGAENGDEANYCTNCKFSLKERPRRPEMRTKKRRLDASVIGYVIVLGVLLVVFKFIEALSGAIEQHFGGVLGTMLSILIWIPGLFGIIGVLLFLSRLLTKLGLRGLNLLK